MRVAMVSEHASPLAVLGGVDAGGQNVHVAGLSAAMVREGAEVVVHTRRDDAGLPPAVQVCGVTVDHVDAGPPCQIPKDELLPHMDEFAERLHDAWAVQRPDVVHAHFWMSGRAALAAAEPLGIPVVQTFHALGVVKRRYQGDKDTSHPGRRAVERAIMRRADAIVATCTDEVAELMREGANVRGITVVPCGVDLGRFTPDGPREARAPGLRRVVVVGRMVERKGIGNAVEALAKLPRTELVVAGGPERKALGADPEARRLVRLARQIGVAERVDMRGSIDRDDVPPLLRSADAVLSVPWYEPFGIVPLEAMACGVPVVASAVGGLLDTVVDSKTGLHVTPRDPNAIAAAVKTLLEDDARRARLGAAGVRRARALYGWDRVATDTLDVYESLLRERVTHVRTAFA
jgi:glycosyltransferase involved in cell wall biosynthesis